MKNILLTMSLVVAMGVLVMQLPLSKLSEQLAMAGVSNTTSAYGTRIGQTVHDVVLNIRAQDKARGEKSYLTHAHVMAIMCQENPRLKGNIRNGEGRYEGLTQVIDGTWRGLLKGKMAKGQCRYINKLEKGVCSAPGARISNPRCSIEIGACLYNYELKRVRGDASLAYNAYNTGSSRKTANGLGDFRRGYNASARGALCAKSRYNWSVWRAMRLKISELTGGQFKTESAQHILTSAAGWPTNARSVPTIRNIGNNWWRSPAGRAVAKGVGQGAQGYAQAAQRAKQEQERRKALVRAQSQRAKQQSWLDKLLGNEQAQQITNLQQAQATLTCNEQVVSSNGKGVVQLNWSCPSGTTVSRGFGTHGAVFKTHGAGAGVTRSVRVVGAEYILQCISGHKLNAEARCIVDTQHRVTAEDAPIAEAHDSIPNGVTMSIEVDPRSREVIWATIGASECNINIGGVNGSGSSGSIRLVSLHKNTVVKLECDTQYGKAIKYKRIMVK